jgi:hypothetical protein
VLVQKESRQVNADMNLDEQVQDLIQNAPQDGVTPTLVRAIAPVLRELASRLQHLEYYIAQTVEGNWAITVLSQTTEPEQQKQVIYGFPTLKDVAASPYPMKDPQMIALPTPIIHVLFQLVALDTVDSLIFFELPGNVTTGIEIRRDELQQLIQRQLQQTPLSIGASVPPDIA